MFFFCSLLFPELLALLVDFYHRDFNFFICIQDATKSIWPHGANFLDLKKNGITLLGVGFKQIGTFSVSHSSVFSAQSTLRVFMRSPRTVKLSSRASDLQGLGEVSEV